MRACQANASNPGKLVNRKSAQIKLHLGYLLLLHKLKTEYSFKGVLTRFGFENKTVVRALLFSPKITCLATSIKISRRDILNYMAKLRSSWKRTKISTIRFIFTTKIGENSLGEIFRFYLKKEGVG